LFNKFRNINFALFDQWIVSGFNFLTAIILARGLGISDFGKYTIIWMTILFFHNIQSTLISAPMLSLAPKQTESEMSDYYGSVTLHQLLFSISSSFLFLGS